MKIGPTAVERIAVCFLLFMATGVSTFARSSQTWETLVTPILLGALSLALALSYGVVISRAFIALIGGYLALFLVQLVVFGSFHPKHLVLYPLNLWVAYTFVNAMHERFFLHMEYLITRLAGVSLVIWSLDVISDGAVRHQLSGITFGQPYNPIVDSYILVQTFIHEGIDSVVPRNSGFAWEPGAFAVFCSVALLINLYRTNFRWNHNRGAVVLLAALLSSQSTTGYNILLLIFLAKLWRDLQGAARMFLPVIAIAMISVVLSLPFMQEKIVDLWQQDLDQLARSATSEWNFDQPVAAQRFLSLRLDFGDFLENPWTGYGGRDSEMLTQRGALNIVSISGIGKVFARFGVFGFGFFLFSTILSSVQLSRSFGARTPVLLAVVILMVSLSYSLIEHPIFVGFWGYWFFVYAGNSISAQSRTLVGSDRA
ncbi:hypothetical protein [Sphaerotilus montanus]|uniref:hypothetical protein n=1 Tax=Sphaerotilus montanus TaxID=522889 RepID=UPI003FA29852